MKDYIRCYVSFLPLIYRVVIFLVLPAAGIGYYLLVSFGMFSGWLMLAAGLVIYVEIWLDYLAFCGMAARRPNGYGYFYTSKRGMSVLRGSLYVDDARRCLSMLFYMLAWCLLNRLWLAPRWGGAVFMRATFAEAAVCALLCYVVLTIAVTVCRMFVLQWVNIIAGFVALLLCSTLLFAAEFLIHSMPPGPAWGICVLALLLALCVTFIKNWFLMKRFRRNYYDEEV